MWQTENGNFESFFSLLLLSLKIWKIRILKRWKTLLGISSFYACVPKTTIIWGTVPEIKSEKEIIFCHFGLFFAPLPYNQPEKSKFWKNEKKKSLQISSFYTWVPQRTIIWCMFPEIWRVTDRTFCLFGLFLFFCLTTQKIKILNEKKHLEILSFYTCVPQMKIIWCMAPKIWSVTDRIFSHFGPFFSPFTPLTVQKIKTLKKWKKKKF